jgi:hypothetical protein
LDNELRWRHENEHGRKPEFAKVRIHDVQQAAWPGAGRSDLLDPEAQFQNFFHAQIW